MADANRGTNLLDNRKTRMSRKTSTKSTAGMDLMNIMDFYGDVHVNISCTYLPLASKSP